MSRKQKDKKVSGVVIVPEMKSTTRELVYSFSSSLLINHAALFIEIFIIIDRFHRVAIRSFGITIALIQHYFSMFSLNGHFLFFCKSLRNFHSGCGERDRVQRLHVLHKIRSHSYVTGTICTVPHAVFIMLKIPTPFFDVILVVVFLPLLFDHPPNMSTSTAQELAHFCQSHKQRES